MSTMEGFSAFFDSQSSSFNTWSFEALKNFHLISPLVQNHLKQVYLTLCCALVATACGAYLHLLWNIGGVITAILSIVSLSSIFVTPIYEERKRLGLLMSSALLQGASLGPLIELAVAFDPSLLIGALVGSALVFGCFSAAAMLARRREYLYLAGFLSSGLSLLMWLQFGSAIFGGSLALFKFELYFGLLLFVGYTVVDTQHIIEMSHLGDLDYVKHAVMLFTDFVALFVRILVIVLKNAAEKDEEKKKKKRRD